MPNAGGSIASYEVGGRGAQAIARATSALGQSVSNMGDALFQIDQKLTKARQASQLSDAVGRATGELGELEIQFQRDQDFKTAPVRFTDQAALLGEKYEQTIDDPIVKDAFKTRYQELLTAKRLNVVQAAAKQEGDYNVASLDRNLDVYAREAVRSANDAERDIVINQARIDIANMRTWGWITDEDAGKRERAFLGKIDQAIITRDMVVNPGEVARKLALDPAYAKNLDPKQRETLIDQAYRRAETEQRQRDAVAERERKQRGDEYMKEAYKRMDAGTLDVNYVESIKRFVEPAEYKALLTGLRGADRKDDPVVFAELEGLVDTNPTEARRQAFIHHKNGLITNSTLSSINTRTRSVERQEGPRSPYERERAHITQILKPSEFVTDPAPGARFALAIREFDDYASGAQRTDKELREKANEVVKRYAMIDMARIARETALGAQPTPEQQLEDIRQQALDLIAKKDAGTLSTSEFNKRMQRLNKAREAAEKARAVNARE